MQAGQYTYRTKIFKGKSLFRFYATNNVAENMMPSFDLALKKGVSDLQLHTSILKKLYLNCRIPKNEDDFYFEITTRQGTVVLLLYTLCTKTLVEQFINDEDVRILFCAEPTIITGGLSPDMDFGFATMDKSSAQSYIDMNESSGCRTLQTSPTTNTKIRMANWYGRELSIALREAAQAEIDRFVYATKFEPEIKDFMVIPQYNVHKYVQSTKLLNFSYNPEILLPLTLMYLGRVYTILIPICEKITRGKMRNANIHGANSKNNS